MTITTKYDIDTKVWVLGIKRAEEAEVKTIQIAKIDGKSLIQYRVSGGGTRWLSEDELYPSKKSLIASL